MSSWLVIETATGTADETAFAVAGKRLVYCRSGTKVQKVLRNPDTIPRLGPDAFENGGGGGVRLGFNGSFIGLKKLGFF